MEAGRGGVPQGTGEHLGNLLEPGRVLTSWVHGEGGAWEGRPVRCTSQKGRASCEGRPQLCSSGLQALPDVEWVTEVEGDSGGARGCAECMPCAPGGSDPAWGHARESSGEMSG